MIKKNLWWLLPILAMAAITPFISSWDMALERYYYHPGHPGKFSSNAFYEFIYHYAPLPAEITGIFAFLALCLSYFMPSFRKWRQPSLALVLNMVIGAGLIVHVALKDHWGRPRPRQVIEFGGKQHFRPYYSPNFFHQPEPSKSFPCGHCTMGFFFFSLALIFMRAGRRDLVFSAVALSFALGIVLGTTRMAQGGHFLSDVIMTAIIMWLSAYICDRLAYNLGADKAA